VLIPLAEEHLRFEVELDVDPEVMRYLTMGPSTREMVEWPTATGSRLHTAHRGWACGLASPKASSWAGGYLDTSAHRPEGQAELGYRLMRRHHRSHALSISCPSRVEAR